MKILKKSAASVTYLFTMFGSFLLNIEPPTSLITGGSVFSIIGYLSFVILAALLVIKSIIKYQKNQSPKPWFIAGFSMFICFCFFGYLYYAQLDQKTFVYFDDTSVIKGDVYHKGALALKNNFEAENSVELTDRDLLAKFGGITNINYVWTIKSIKKNERRLNLIYVATVISISITLFCIIEGVLERVENPSD